MKRQDVLDKIQEIREKGYKVYVNHYRYIKDSGYIPQQAPQYMSKQFDFLPNGGRTELLIKKDNEVVAKTEAHCCLKDPFNKKLGLNICMGRLLKDVQF